MKKKIITTSLVLMLIIVNIVNVYAGTKRGTDWYEYVGGYNKRNVDVYTSTAFSYSKQFNNAMAEWNAVLNSRKVYHGYTGTNRNLITSYSKSTAEYGWHTVKGWGSASGDLEASSFEIGLNERLLNGKSDKIIQSVAGHELGHALGLEDISNAKQLMSPSRNRSTIYYPQDGDEYGANKVATDAGWR